MNALITCLLTYLTVTSAFVADKQHFCLTCCGSATSGCCNDCGLDTHSLTTLQKKHITDVEKRRVMSSRSFVDDLQHGLSGFDLPGMTDACYDCCGPHPCCNNCGLDELLHHHYGTVSTAKPQSPEKDQSYGTEGQPGVYAGYPDILTGLDPLDIKPAHSYFEQQPGQ